MRANKLVGVEVSGAGVVLGFLLGSVNIGEMSGNVSHA
jgi:hypothetical protein